MQKSLGGTNMKTKKIRRYANDYRHSRPYPGAADNRYFAEKLLDTVTSVVTGLGIMTLLFFLITL